MMKLSPEEINPLNIKIGSKKGRKTNIKIPKEPKISKRKPKNSDISSEQKWRLYKTNIEPKLTEQMKTDEPNELNETIREALKDINISNTKNILDQAKKDTTDISNEIITPLHLTSLTSLADKRKNYKESLKQTEEDIKRRGQLISTNAGDVFSALRENAYENKDTKGLAFDAIKQYVKLQNMKDKQDLRAMKNTFLKIQEYPNELDKEKKIEQMTVLRDKFMKLMEHKRNNKNRSLLLEDAKEKAKTNSFEALNYENLLSKKEQRNAKKTAKAVRTFLTGSPNSPEEAQITEEITSPSQFKYSNAEVELMTTPIGKSRRGRPRKEKNTPEYVMARESERKQARENELKTNEVMSNLKRSTRLNPQPLVEPFRTTPFKTAKKLAKHRTNLFQ